MPPASTRIEVNPGAYKVSFSDRIGNYGSGYYSTSGFTYNWNVASTGNGLDLGRTADVVLPLALHIQESVIKSAGVPLAGIESRRELPSGGNYDYTYTDDARRLLDRRRARRLQRLVYDDSGRTHRLLQPLQASRIAERCQHRDRHFGGRHRQRHPPVAFDQGQVTKAEAAPQDIQVFATTPPPVRGHHRRQRQLLDRRSTRHLHALLPR